MRLGKTEIDGAACEAWLDQHGKPYALYQQRRDGELRWYAVYRDSFYDGWTGESLWAPSAEEAAQVAREMGLRNMPLTDPVYPFTSTEAVGWSPAQIGKAIVWAGECEAEATRQIAKMFAPVREAAE